MIADINKYVDFLTINKLSEHCFLILWLVHTKDQENIKKYKNAFGNFDSNAIQYLIDTGWLIDLHFSVDSSIREYNINDFMVTDKFVKNTIVDEEDAYQELCSVYPKWMTIKGNKVPMITGDPYKLAKEYHKYHKNNKITHERVMSITSRYFKDHPPQVNIQNYILNRHWNQLEELISNVSVFKQL